MNAHGFRVFDADGHVLEEFLEEEALSRDARQNIVYNNALNFYRLNKA